MKIDDIISTLEKYGFSSKKSYITDPAWIAEQSFNKVPVEKRTERKELTVKFIWNDPITEKEIDLAIYEDISVNSNGTLYYTPGKSHYYFSFKWEISRIYREDELDILFYDINKVLSTKIGLVDLRDIKLISMGI